MTPGNYFFKSLALAGGVIILLLVSGCSFGKPSGQDPDFTLTAMSASIAGTATSQAEESSATGGDLATAQAVATERNLEIQATQTAVASNRSESQLATATVAAPVLAELPRYGVDTQDGHVAWLHNPVTIEVEGYQQFGFANDYMQFIVRDFVLAADVTWDTQYGSSGCGYMFRSNGDKVKPNQYMIIASRMGNGHVLFSAVAGGELANVHDFYAGQLDSSFQWQNGTKNRMVVVGRGTIFEIYTNGVKIGVVDTTQPPTQPQLPSKPKPPADQTNPDVKKRYQDQLKEYTDLVEQVQSNYQIALKNSKTLDANFPEGFVGMIAASESGRTVCQFDNAWLWMIGE